MKSIKLFMLAALVGIVFTNCNKQEVTPVKTKRVVAETATVRSNTSQLSNARVAENKSDFEGVAVLNGNEVRMYIPVLAKVVELVNGHALFIGGQFPPGTVMRATCTKTYKDGDLIREKYRGRPAVIAAGN